LDELWKGLTGGDIGDLGKACFRQKWPLGGAVHVVHFSGLIVGKMLILLKINDIESMVDILKNQGVLQHT
jgi:hypothetical protein